MYDHSGCDHGNGYCVPVAADQAAWEAAQAFAAGRAAALAAWDAEYAR